MRYRSEQGEDTVRIVWPIAIAYYDAARLVIAHCEMRRAFRSFRTDRMAEAQVMPDRYPTRRKVLLKQWQEEMQRESGNTEIDYLG